MTSEPRYNCDLNPSQKSLHSADIKRQVNGLTPQDQNTEYPLVTQQYPLVKHDYYAAVKQAEQAVEDVVIVEDKSSENKFANLSVDTNRSPDSEKNTENLNKDFEVLKPEEARLEPRPSEVCSQCGRAYSDPDMCPECGQALLPLPELCNFCGQSLPDGWKLKNKGRGKFLYIPPCPASTSRKVSNSSGDYDSDEGSHCSQCTCGSNNYYPIMPEKPCIIADSATLLRKSKWQNFKNYFRRKNKANNVKCRKSDTKKNKDAVDTQNDPSQGTLDSNVVKKASRALELTKYPM